ncbi:hypothetical protein BC830DRAFT_764409 [Chytriomyces sp. MP71]|nr:hypothetical protein BC830DRAFT_764409 [Chytriomyces sp. MP71]
MSCGVEQNFVTQMEQLCAKACISVSWEETLSGSESNRVWTVKGKIQGYPRSYSVSHTSKEHAREMAAREMHSVHYERISALMRKNNSSMNAAETGSGWNFRDPQLTELQRANLRFLKAEAEVARLTQLLRRRAPPDDEDHVSCPMSDAPEQRRLAHVTTELERQKLRATNAEVQLTEIKQGTAQMVAHFQEQLENLRRENNDMKAQLRALFGIPRASIRMASLVASAKRMAIPIKVLNINEALSSELLVRIFKLVAAGFPRMRCELLSCVCRNWRNLVQTKMSSSSADPFVPELPASMQTDDYALKQADKLDKSKGQPTTVYTIPTYGASLTESNEKQKNTSKQNGKKKETPANSSAKARKKKAVRIPKEKNIQESRDIWEHVTDDIQSLHNCEDHDFMGNSNSNIQHKSSNLQLSNEIHFSEQYYPRPSDLNSELSRTYKYDSGVGEISSPNDHSVLTPQSNFIAPLNEAGPSLQLCPEGSSHIILCAMTWRSLVARQCQNSVFQYDILTFSSSGLSEDTSCFIFDVAQTFKRYFPTSRRPFQMVFFPSVCDYLAFASVIQSNRKLTKYANSIEIGQFGTLDCRDNPNPFSRNQCLLVFSTVKGPHSAIKTLTLERNREYACAMHNLRDFQQVPNVLRLNELGIFSGGTRHLQHLIEYSYHGRRDLRLPQIIHFRSQYLSKFVFHSKHSAWDAQVLVSTLNQLRQLRCFEYTCDVTIDGGLRVNHLIDVLRCVPRTLEALTIGGLKVSFTVGTARDALYDPSGVLHILDFAGAFPQLQIFRLILGDIPNFVSETTLKSWLQNKLLLPFGCSLAYT